MHPVTLPIGYALRPAHHADAPALVELVACCARELDLPCFTLADVEADWETPGFDRGRDTRVVLDTEAKVVGYAVLFAVQRPPVHPYLWGRVHPEHRGRGLGTALVRWGLARAQDLVPQVPEGVRLSVYAPSPVGFAPSETLLRAEGFRVCRSSLDMRIELHDELDPPVWPFGIAPDAYRHPDDLEAVAHAAHESFRDHRGSVDESFESYFGRFQYWHAQEPGFDPRLWFLARDGARIAGVLIGRTSEGADDETGYVSTLCVRRPWRRRGIALALLRQAFCAYQRRGKRAVALSVDAESLTGAVALYEKAGMWVRRTTATWEREIRPGRELGRA